MGHLGQSTPITVVQDKEIVLTGADGQTFKMKLADLAEAVRQVMPVATSDKNGLISAERLVFFNQIDIRKANESGSGILAEGAGFCFGYDRNTPTAFCLFFFFREPNKAPAIRYKIAGNLELGAQNSAGTSIIAGATDYISFATKR